MNILPELCMSSGRQRKLPAARVCRASRPPCLPTRARAGAGASSLIPVVLGLSVSMMLAPRVGRLLEQAGESQGVQPQELSQSLEAAMVSGTRAAEISNRQRPPEHPVPSMMPRLPAHGSRSRSRSAGWYRSRSLPRRRPWLPQLLKPSSPSPERGCREVSSALHRGSDRRVGG